MADLHCLLFHSIHMYSFLIYFKQDTQLRRGWGTLQRGQGGIRIDIEANSRCVSFTGVTSAPHQDAFRGSHHVPEDFHKADSLENELPGKSGLHPVPPENQEPVSSLDVSQIQNADIDVKDILLRFFKKLKNHPEILQQLIESEEKRLLDGYENMLDLEQMESNPDSNLNLVPAVENPIPVPYQSEKMVVKKGGSSQLDFDPEYDPRSSPGFSGPISGSDINNNIPLVPANQQHNAQPSAEEIAKLEKQQSPFINSLPLFDKLPNPPADDKLTAPDIKADIPSPVKSHKTISQASFDSNIEEIKHVPIREELASEVPPSLLADKIELREEAHQALKKAEAEALKTKKFQATLQKEQLKQMAEAQKAKQAQEVDEQEHKYDQQTQEQQVGVEDPQQPELSEDSQGVQQPDADPYGYYYYYYNYPELAQQIFNDDAEESNESYQPEDSSVSDSVESSQQEDSNESVDNSSQNDSSVSGESPETSISNSNESEGNYVSSEEVTVDGDNEKSLKEQSSDKEIELKALTKPQSVQKANEMNNM
ncbi:hypothetical protein LOTGIDRAFT_234950 [Lottia gigantea]|uniref:Uncharacterized protein n=1 Tax=Lottia gigantea TaxID=225164 RepID=V4BFJ6_LOTGI|nr:hypothetical protein LOTGIDRAFT_234950 [Lottia gigantea]ESO87709.1 hypothetical protein LOTGIDRAFT_234950 [Lottia gigantea]